MDLAEFLLARLTEDEATATAAAGPHGASFQGRSFSLSFDKVIEDAYDMLGREIDEHITHWSPARVLAEVEAKRRILDEHSEFMDSPSFGKPLEGKGICRRCCDIEGSDWDGPPTQKYPCDTLRLLVLPYADHPSCHPSWLPAVKA